jgi:uncharacterized membrane protein YfhO
LRGYQAHLNGKKLSVESADGLCPIVRVPAGLSGRLKLEYWPGWLVYGGACAIFSASNLFAWVNLCRGWREELLRTLSLGFRHS